MEMGVAYNPVLSFTADYVYAGYYGDYYYTNAVRVGFGYDYTAYGYGTYPGPYFSVFAYEGEGAAIVASFDGSTLAMDGALEGSESVRVDMPFALEACADATVAGEGGGSALGNDSLDCEGTQMDIWELSTAAGQTYTVTVDTVNAESAFDPLMVLTDGETCMLGSGDDDIDCTYPPPTYSCPSQVIEGTGAPVWIFVTSLGDCAGTSSDYVLKVDYSSITAPLVTLESDDAAATVDTPYSFEYSFTGAVTPAE
jgi:hypothetical protein